MPIGDLHRSSLYGISKKDLCSKKDRCSRHFTRAIYLSGNQQEKCRTPSPRHPFCASLRNRNAYGYFTRAILHHFARRFTRKMPDASPAASVLFQPAQSKCTWTCQKRHLVRKFTGKMLDPYTATSILCEPAQSKCTCRTLPRPPRLNTGP